MDWKVTASLIALGVLMVGLLVLSLVIGVGKYVKQFADPAAKPKPRGFEVKPKTLMTEENRSHTEREADSSAETSK